MIEENKTSEHAAREPISNEAREAAEYELQAFAINRYFISNDIGIYVQEAITQATAQKDARIRQLENDAQNTGGTIGECHVMLDKINAPGRMLTNRIALLIQDFTALQGKMREMREFITTRETYPIKICERCQALFASQPEHPPIDYSKDV